jgi:protein-disulfide isomerase
VADLAEPIGPRDHLLGGGDPTIVEYGDYECPYSRAAYRYVQRLLRSRDGPLRFAFRHFPIAERHPHAQLAAEAAEAAAAQGAFWPMHDLLFHGQAALERDDLRAYAARLDLDRRRFDRELDRGTYAARVAADLRSGELSGVRNIPTLFIDGSLHRGGYDAAALLTALEGSAGGERS